MELYFSDNAEKDMAEYVRKNYPGVTAGLSGGDGGTESVLTRAGVSFARGEELFSDEVKLYIGMDSARSYYEARVAAAESEHILCVKTDIGAALSDIAFLGYRTIKCKYPKAVFFTSNGDELGAEAYSFLMRLYVSLIDAGLSSRYASDAVLCRRLIPEAKRALAEPGSAEDMIRAGRDIVLKAHGAESSFAAADALCPEGRAGSAMRFLCYYIALFIGIRFTKFHFRSILLGKDAARARAIAESRGVAPGGKRRVYSGGGPLAAFAAGFMPGAEELYALGEGYIPPEGAERATPAKALETLLAADEISAGGGFFASIHSTGFTDALLGVLKRGAG